MAARKIVRMDVEDLNPHPQNLLLYGPPRANSAYKDIKLSMERFGFDDRHPLLVTNDKRIIHGVTRWDCAKKSGIKQVPCEVFQPESEATAELEIEREILRGNLYRVKTQLIIAREQRKALEIETALARQRMGGGSDGGPSKATDRVGKIFGESGKTVQRRLKILKGIEEHEHGIGSRQGKPDRKKAEQLTHLLESGQTVKALEAIDGAKQKKAEPVKKVEVPKTFHEHVTKAYSEFFEACAKAQVPAEVEILAATIDRLRADLSRAQKRVAGT